MKDVGKALFLVIILIIVLMTIMCKEYKLNNPKGVKTCK
jgi:hypothetical protein